MRKYSRPLEPLIPAAVSLYRGGKSAAQVAVILGVSKPWVVENVRSVVRSQATAIRLSGAACALHGESVGSRKAGSVEYRAWSNMKQRCSNPRNDNYEYYGGRGVTVCDHWQRNYAAFRFWVGPRPSPKHSIDRIDPDGHYAPGNVRWATVSEQRNNRRDSTRREAEK